jgi:hypothetical protein
VTTKAALTTIDYRRAIATIERCIKNAATAKAIYTAARNLADNATTFSSISAVEVTYAMPPGIAELATKITENAQSAHDTTSTQSTESSVSQDETSVPSVNPVVVLLNDANTAIATLSNYSNSAHTDVLSAKRDLNQLVFNAGTFRTQCLEVSKVLETTAREAVRQIVEYVNAEIGQLANDLDDGTKLNIELSKACRSLEEQHGNASLTELISSFTVTLQTAQRIATTELASMLNPNSSNLAHDDRRALHELDRDLSAIIDHSRSIESNAASTLDEMLNDFVQTISTVQVRVTPPPSGKPSNLATPKAAAAAAIDSGTSHDLGPFTGHEPKMIAMARTLSTSAKQLAEAAGKANVLVGQIRKSTDAPEQRLQTDWDWPATVAMWLWAVVLVGGGSGYLTYLACEGSSRPAIILLSAFSGVVRKSVHLAG